MEHTANELRSLGRSLLAMVAPTGGEPMPAPADPALADALADFAASLQAWAHVVAGHEPIDTLAVALMRGTHSREALRRALVGQPLHVAVLVELDRLATEVSPEGSHALALRT